MLIVSMKFHFPPSRVGRTCVAPRWCREWECGVRNGKSNNESSFVLSLYGKGVGERQRLCIRSICYLIPRGLPFRFDVVVALVPRPTATAAVRVHSSTLLGTYCDLMREDGECGVRIGRSNNEYSFVFSLSGEGLRRGSAFAFD